jgi:hypothetical protein
VQDNLNKELAERDWGVQQVLTSANWGGVVGNFFTGGLNLQVEHHLFPAISFMHYPAIAAIVADECKKRGIQVRGPGAVSMHRMRLVVSSVLYVQRSRWSDYVGAGCVVCPCGQSCACCNKPSSMRHAAAVYLVATRLCP